MTGSDLVFVAATVFALAGSGAVWLFAKNVERRHRPTPTAASAAAGEEASRPFDGRRGILATQSLRDSMTAIIRGARKKGGAVDMRIPTNVQLTRKRESEKEVA